MDDATRRITKREHPELYREALNKGPRAVEEFFMAFEFIAPGRREGCLGVLKEIFDEDDPFTTKLGHR